MKKPELNKVDLEDAILRYRNRTEKKVITMDRGQWDALLSEAYQAGWLLLEIGRRHTGEEFFRAAYQKQG